MTQVIFGGKGTNQVIFAGKNKEKAGFFRAGQFYSLFLLSYGVAYDHISVYYLLSDMVVRIFQF